MSTTITTTALTTATANLGAVVATDSSLGVVGIADTQGGIVALVGGASSTSANAGGAVTVTGGAGGATGVGGAVTIAAAAGGSTSGAGGVVSVTGGAGTAGNANGGNVTITGGALQGSGLSGVVQVHSTLIKTQGAPSAETTAATLTIAELLGGIITGTHTAGATAAYTLPTGTLSDGGAVFANNDSVDWSLINLSAAAVDTITLTAGTGHTIVGNPIVQSAHASTGGIYGNSGMFRTRKTATNTFITYRIG